MENLTLEYIDSIQTPLEVINKAKVGVVDATYGYIKSDIFNSISYRLRNLCIEHIENAKKSKADYLTVKATGDTVKGKAEFLEMCKKDCWMYYTKFQQSLEKYYNHKQGI